MILCSVLPSHLNVLQIKWIKIQDLLHGALSICICRLFLVFAFVYLVYCMHVCI